MTDTLIGPELRDQARETGGDLACREYDADLWRSARNIARLRVTPAADLNAYDLLCQKRLLITRDAIDRLRKQEST